MTKYKVYKQRIVSPDGRSVAEVTSRVSTNDDNQAKVEQNVDVRVDGSSSYISTQSHVRVRVNKQW